MKEQFVTYEIASKLKELGFNEECFTTFDDEKRLRNPFDYKVSDYEKVDISYIEDCRHFTRNSELTLKSYLKRGNPNHCFTQFITAPLWQQAIQFLNDILLKHGYTKSDNIYIWDDGMDLKGLEKDILEAIELCQNKK